MSTVFTGYFVFGFWFNTEIKNTKQQVEQEQTQTNVEMTLLSQEDGDVNREDAPVT